MAAMNLKEQQTVLLGVTGSIAAYKACELLRLLQKAGLRVKVVMTAHALELVGAATFRALTGEPVALQLFDDPAKPIFHIALAEEADVFVIAPCTANVLNKIANGVADDLLTTTALATTAPLVLAPAMNVHMLENPQTQASFAALKARGAHIVGPGEGYLACGSEDSGRMSDPEEIAAATLEALARTQSMAGMRVLITAGPTREYLDPVRFISSPSSGRTGYALAREAHMRGAEVVLVSGPTELKAPRGIQLVSVTTAAEMFEATGEHFDAADLAIFSAAVADFRPLNKTGHKLKKGACLPESKGEGVCYTAQFVANPDILALLAARRKSAKAARPYIVGFAAETENVVQNAEAKLKAKGADLIVANDVSDPATGFASTHNRLIFVSSEGEQGTELLSKDELAKLILDTALQKMC